MNTLPVTLIGGYLGAGKTTLVNHLLRERGGRRLAVLVNDFGDINIDADLIEAQDNDVISLAGGCVCCSFGSDLMSALTRIVDASARFDHLLIETSGVALPEAVARTLKLVSTLQLDTTLVIADAMTVREQSSDRYVGDMIRTQLSGADLILLNKTDLIDEPEASATQRWLTEQVPQARVVSCIRAEGMAALVFADRLGLAPPADNTEAWQPQTPTSRTSASGSAFFSRSKLQPTQAISARDQFMSFVLHIDDAVDPRELVKRLTVPELKLLRAKGVVRDALGDCFQIQIAGRRAEVMPLSRPTQVAGQLVVIGLKDHLNHTDLIGAIQACRVDRDKIAH